MRSRYEGCVVRTRIKFCGMTRAGDVRFACELGVDAIGFVFAARSPRRLRLHDAEPLRNAVAPLVSVVALCMDNPPGEVARIIDALEPDLLQFHGQENDAFCAAFGVPFLKVLPMDGVSAGEAIAQLAQYPSAAGFIFDGHARGAPGGSGQAFDWSQLPQDIARPWLLAGGLNPGNVATAIRSVRPWGVDVSSGIELTPGVKDAESMLQFVREVMSADGSF
jgi:phosphoribosylanthranilate isomerase